MGDDGDLIELFPSKKGAQSDHEAPVRNQPRYNPDERYCSHGRVSLHHESRRVYCVDCSREVPAFDALKKLAREWERYKNHRDQARTDAKRAQERLDDLKRQEANTRSRLRTVRRKLAKTDPTWAALDKLAHDRRHYITVESLRAVLYAEVSVESQEAQGA